LEKQKNYKKEIKDLKLRLLTGRSQRQVPIFQWQGMGPARTGRGAASVPTYLLNLLKPEIAPFYPPTRKPHRRTKYEVDRTTPRGDMAI